MKIVYENSKVYSELMEQVCHRAHDRVVQSCQYYGANMPKNAEYGDEEYEEIYNEEWLKEYRKVFKDIEVLSEGF